MREVDAIALVLNDFESGADPLRALNDLLTDMILADMTVVENRRARLKKEKARPLEEAVLERCAKTLENEESLRNLAFNPDEENLLSGFGFLSRKPVLALFNQGDDKAGLALAPQYDEELKRRGLEGLALAGKVEMEIAQLDEADREAFLKEIGIQESARNRFIRASYRLLNLISFLTTGDDEVRAWTITKGTNARKAAGKIHSDIERGFIRAEAVAYDRLHRLWQRSKMQGSGQAPPRRQGLCRPGRRYRPFPFCGLNRAEIVAI